MIINCKYCNKEIKTYPSSIKNGKEYCSRECYNKNRLLIKTCEYCGNEFKTYPYLIKFGYGIYCSRKCRNKGRLIKYPEIIEINKKCFDEARILLKRENHPSWRGGISSSNELLRKSKPIKEWRMSVFKRDNYTCQKCKIKGGILNAHHIVQLSKNKILANDLNNGITLCEQCHKKEHRKLQSF